MAERHARLAPIGACAALAAALALPGTLALPGPLLAAGSPGPGPTVVVIQRESAEAGRVIITVGGTGFAAVANNGVGIYVVFGPMRAAEAATTDSLLYGAARWVHRGAAPESAGQAPMAADGSFETTLEIEPRYVDGHGIEVDCRRVACGVLTMAAHGAPDRSQDTATPVEFGPSPADPHVGGLGLPWDLLAIAPVMGLAAIVLVWRLRRGSGESR